MMILSLIALNDFRSTEYRSRSTLFKYFFATKLVLEFFDGPHLLDVKCASSVKWLGGIYCMYDVSECNKFTSVLPT